MGAIVTTRLRGESVRDLLAKLVRVRGTGAWIPIVIVLPLVVLAASLAIAAALGQDLGPVVFGPRVLLLAPITMLAAVALYTLNLVGVSMIYSVAVVRSGGSVLVAILLHMAINSAASVILPAFPATSVEAILRVNFIQSMIMLGIVLVLIAAYPVGKTRREA